MVETQGRRLYALVAISIISLSLFSGAALSMLYGLTLGKPSVDTILVTGTGSVIVNPDIASFVVTIVTNAQNAAQAAELNAKTTNMIVSALKNASSFYRVDVNTGDYFVYQSSDQSGYQASRNLAVVMEDTYAVGRLVDVALSNGATSVSQVSYDLSKAKREQADAEATRLAIDNAFKKAKQMADNMSVQLGHPTIAKISAYTSEAGPSGEHAASGPRQIEYVVAVEISYTFT